MWVPRKGGHREREKFRSHSSADRYTLILYGGGSRQLACKHAVSTMALGTETASARSVADFCPSFSDLIASR